MLRLEISLQLIGIFVLWLLCSSCSAEARYHPGGPYYYGSFADYKIPFQPIEELTQEKAKLRESYYVAYFDGDGRIVSFTKYFKGKKEFHDGYTYSSGGLLERREITKYTGEVTIQYFNNKGEITKTEILKQGEKP